LLGTSSAVDQDFSCTTATPCRWGDYAGASPDPLNANVVWGSSQVTGACFIICGLFAQWQTRNFAMEVAAAPPPPPPTPPSAPQSLTATGADASVTLNWLAPTSDGGSQVTDYTVYRGTSAGSEVLIASSGGALTYTDTGLTNGQPYYYVVHAVNVVGEGPASNEASATPQPSITPPSAPRNLAVAPFRPHGLRLTWLAPLTDGGSEVTAYQIWRGTAPGAETLYVTVGAVTGYIDAGATNKRVRYYYVVRAVNTAGAGPPSNEVNALGR
jgi:predicted phage tail protein